GAHAELKEEQLKDPLPEKIHLSAAETLTRREISKDGSKSVALYESDKAADPEHPKMWYLQYALVKQKLIMQPQPIFAEPAQEGGKLFSKPKEVSIGSLGDVALKQGFDPAKLTLRLAGQMEGGFEGRGVWALFYKGAAETNDAEKKAAAIKACETDSYQ